MQLSTTLTQVAVLLWCSGSCLADPPPVIKLDKHEQDPSVIFRSYGGTNHLDTGPYGALAFTPFIVQSSTYRMPYGDRVGYDTCAMFDVNGDGFQDWVETWYHAEPSSAVTGAPRIPINAVIMPCKLPPDVSPCPVGTANCPPMPSTTRAQLLAEGQPNTGFTVERVGFCRVISGKDSTQIGPEIWGHSDNARLAHEISRISDIDGDGRGEVVLSSNTTDAGRGSINVFSFTSRYNTLAGDTTERWVCIMRIVGTMSTFPGDGPGSSEFAYELEDTFPDVNGDGQPDILAASVWWRTSGDRGPMQRGAGWVFLTPKKEVFQAIAASAAWPAAATDPNVKSCLVMSENDFSLRVANPVSATTSPLASETALPMGDLASAGDVDGDGVIDFVANAGYTFTDEQTEQVFHKRGFYFFLSGDGYKDAPAASRKSLNVLPRYTGLNAAGTEPVYVDPAHPQNASLSDGGFSLTKIDLEPKHADFVIHGLDVAEQWDGRSTLMRYDFDYNRQSIFGMQLDNWQQNPASTVGDGDIALFTHHQFFSGFVQIMLNMPARFQVDGPLEPCIAEEWNNSDPGYNGPADAANPGLYKPPLAFPFNNVPGGAQYTVVNQNQDSCTTCLKIEGSFVTGVNISGNTDGKGSRDCELAIGTLTRVYNEFYGQTSPDTPYAPNGELNILNLPSVHVINVPDATVSGGQPTSSGPQLPTIFTVVGEQYVYANPNQPPSIANPRLDPLAGLYDTNFRGDLADLGTVQTLGGLAPEPGWDQDRDGLDDLILRNTFFPALVTHVSNGTSGGPVIPLYKVNDSTFTVQPYFVDGGANYVVLSPPATPKLIDDQVEVTYDGLEVVFIFSATGFAPDKQPFDEFAPADVKFLDECQGTAFAVAQGVEAVFVPSTAASPGVAAVPAHRRVKVRFLLADLLNGPSAGYLSFPTRWKSNGHGFCFYVKW